MENPLTHHTFHETSDRQQVVSDTKTAQVSLRCTIYYFFPLSPDATYRFNNLIWAEKHARKMPSSRI